VRTPLPKKPSVLFVECHPEPEPENLKFYLDWLAPHFEITHLHVTAMTSTEVNQDAVVISGSKWQITKNPVPQVLSELCRTFTKPLLGVCYGHQTLAHAWGARIVKKSFLKKDETIRVARTERLLEDMGLFFTAHESHAEHVVKDGKLKKHFEVLAFSDSCKVEVIKHHERPLWGVQFHPERSGSTGMRLAENFARIAAFHAK